VLGFNVDLPVITNIISDIKVGKTGYEILADKDWTVVAHAGNPEYNFHKIDEIGIDNMPAEGLSEGLNNVSIGGVDKFVNVYTSEKTGYRYITVIDEAEVGAAARDTRLIIGGAILIVIILMALASLWLSNRIAAPVNKLGEAVTKVTCGDLRSINLDGKASTDEIGTLLTQFKQMAEGLKVLITEIGNESENVASSAKNLTEGSEQTATTITHVAETVGGVANAVSAQSQSVDNIVGKIREMSEQIDSISANIDHLQGASNNAGSAASEGIGVIETAVRQMGDVKATVDESAKVIGRLGERSQEIGNIIDTIAGIAEQTNLLALNAAIEAARAGEQGKGFAVVAGEVGKLAEQSQEATEQIASIISVIQSDTQRAVESMEKGTQEVQRGSEAVGKAGVHFRNIAEMINNVDRLVRESAVEAGTIAEHGKAVLSDAVQIDEATKKIAGHIDTISAASQEQSASMQEIASSSNSLSSMAENLKAAISTFKY
jgi:methyl-accepting chemotaxis protein